MFAVWVPAYLARIITVVEKMLFIDTSAKNCHHFFVECWNILKANRCESINDKTKFLQPTLLPLPPAPPGSSAGLHSLNYVLLAASA